MKGDFHIHTTYSDGFLSVDEVLEEASKKVDVLAITDHDSVLGAIEAYDKIKKYPLKLILGVELSTYYQGESVHILGYFHDIKDIEPIKDFLANQRELRRERCVEISKKLKKYYDIDLDISRLMKRSAVTRGSIAAEMIRQGMPYTNKEIFEKFLGENCKAYIPSTKVSTEEGIKLLRKCGAIIVLAHPVRFKTINPQDIIDMGVDGLEALYSINTPSDNEKYLKLARENNLFITAGSDFHFFNDFQHGDIGCVSLQGEDLNKFLSFFKK